MWPDTPCRHKYADQPAPIFTWRFAPRPLLMVVNRLFDFRSDADTACRSTLVSSHVTLVPFTIPHFELLVPGDSMKEYRGLFLEPQPYVGNHYASQPEPRAALAVIITRMDGDVGRSLDLLQELHLDDQTIVFFTIYNGCYLAGRTPV